MLERIREFETKIEGAFSTLRSAETQKRHVLALCNWLRRHPVSNLDQYAIADALGFTASNISNWRRTRRPQPGRLLDLAVLLGMGPSEETLARIEFEQTGATASPPYPGDVYAMLDRWNDESPAWKCWVALAGSRKQLEALQKIEHSPEIVPTGGSADRDRGGSAQFFLRLYCQNIHNLVPRLLDEVLWERERPSRVLYRAERNIPLFLRSVHNPAPVSTKIRGSDEPPQLPAWLDSQHDSRLFDSELPSIGQSRFEIEEKAALYGGRSALGGRFSPVEHVVAGHAFNREVVTTIYNRIEIATSSCTSFTLQARPGGGLSLALAQLVAFLAEREKMKVIWIVGDVERTKKAISSLTEKLAEEMVKYVNTIIDCENLVVVIDDISRVPSDQILRLIKFRQRCKILAQTYVRPRFTFVFGSFGAARTCSEDSDFVLELTHADQVKCYDKMASHKPAIISEQPGGFAALIKAHPEARWYADDAQALIDFLLEHGKPEAGAVDFWLARTDFSSAIEGDIVGVAAVSQLVGLSVPIGIARAVFTQHMLPQFHDAEELARHFKGIVVVDDGWQGIGLSSPRRARSILERLGCYSVDFLKDTYQILLNAALNHYDGGRPGGWKSLDFGRQLFQRLSKSELYVFADRIMIVNHLLELFIARLSNISSVWSLAEKAQWAGTLSGTLTRKSGRVDPVAPAQLACGTLVLDLSERALAEIGSATPVTTSIAVSLLRAGRRLVRSAILSGSAQPLSEKLLEIFDQTMVRNILESQLQSTETDRVYRANELVHAYCRLEEEARKYLNRQNRCFVMTPWLVEVSRLFADFDAALDAGNWLQRAHYIWIHRAPEQRRQRDLDFKKTFITKAAECIDFHPQAQGTWAPAVHRAQLDLHSKYAKPSQAGQVD